MPRKEMSVRYQRIEFAAKLAAIKSQAGSLGLLRTMQRLDIAVKEVGFEIAEQLEGASKDAKQHTQ